MNTIMFNKLKDYHQQHRHVFTISFFVLGFIFDLLTLGQIDDTFNIIFQAIYLLLCYFILLSSKTNFSDTENKALKIFILYRTDIFHFLIGSLLSAFTIFYFKSSSFSTSFIFILFIVSLLLVNELEFVQNLGMTMKSILLKICTLSFLIYFLPIIFNTNSSYVFYLALFVAAGITLFVFNIFKKRLSVNEEELKKEFLYPRMLVVVVFFVLYITNIFPPLPLSLSHLGIYHKVEKNYPEYKLSYEKPWYNFWDNADEHFIAQESDKVYAFFKIFSPGKFKGKIWVEWYKYDLKKNRWNQSDRIPVKIEGGRSDGYRGFISKANYSFGEWKIIVKTNNNLTLGNIKFDIIQDKGHRERSFKVVVDK